MQKTRGVALLAASFLAMSGLAACGDEGGESESSSSTASPSAPEKESTSEASASGDASESSSAETSESESSGGESEGGGEVVELPAAAKKQTKAGAIAFNEFYWEQVGESYKTGNPYVFDTYTRDCAVCDNIAGKVRDADDAGTHMDKNPYSTRDSSATARKDSGFRVELTVDIEEYHEVLEDGSTGNAVESGAFTTVSDTQWIGGQWEIRDQVRTK